MQGKPSPSSLPFPGIGRAFPSLANDSKDLKAETPTWAFCLQAHRFAHRLQVTSNGVEVGVLGRKLLPEVGVDLVEHVSPGLDVTRLRETVFFKRFDANQRQHRSEQGRAERGCVMRRQASTKEFVASRHTF